MNLNIQTPRSEVTERAWFEWEDSFVSNMLKQGMSTMLKTSLVLKILVNVKSRRLINISGQGSSSVVISLNLSKACKHIEKRWEVGFRLCIHDFLFVL